MKLTVPRDSLATAAAWAARAVPNRPPVPVLAGIKLTAGEGMLAMSAFDYDTSCETAVPAAIGEPGEALVPGRLLTEIAASLPDKDVTLAVEDQRLRVSCGTARFTLLTMPLEDYPALPALPPEAGQIGAEALWQAVAAAEAAAGRDDTLPALTGVRVEVDGDKVTLVATDRYRLAVRDAAWEASPAATAVLVPARALADAAKAMRGADVVTVHLALGEQDPGIAGFCGDGKTLTTRLLGGEFPGYQNLLPAAFTGCASLDVAEFSAALKRVALVAERNTAVRLSFSPGEVSLEAATGEEAQGRETVPCGYEGDEFVIAFNPGYLLDGLGVFAGAGWERAELRFTGPGKAALLVREEAGVPVYRYLIMPVRVGG